MIDIHRLNTYRKGLRVERLHTVPHLTSYSNGHHSANAALIAYELCLLNSVEDHTPVLLYMLMHDVAEGYTGDIPGNVKAHYPNFDTMLAGIEIDWEEENLPNMPKRTVGQKHICKIADLAELGMYCIDELAIGNINVGFVLKNVIEYLDEYHNYKGVPTLHTYFVKEWEKL